MFLCQRTSALQRVDPCFSSVAVHLVVHWLFFMSYLSRRLSTRSWYWTTVEMSGELRMTSWLMLSLVSGLYFRSQLSNACPFSYRRHSYAVCHLIFLSMSGSLLMLWVIWLSFEEFLTSISNEYMIFFWEWIFCCSVLQKLEYVEWLSYREYALVLSQHACIGYFSFSLLCFLPGWLVICIYSYFLTCYSGEI